MLINHFSMDYSKISQQLIIFEIRRIAMLYLQFLAYQIRSY